MKEVTQSIIAVIVVFAGVVSLFFAVDETSARILQTMAGMVLGYYFGAVSNPLLGVLGRKK